MKKKLLTVVFLCALSIADLAALSIDDVLPRLSRDDREKLKDKKELVLYTEGKTEFKYLPDTPLSDRIRRKFEGFDPNVSDEALFIMPLPAKRDDPSLFLYNKLRAISSLSGITYFSNRKKETQILFSDVYAIDGLDSKRRIPDRTYSYLPSDERVLIHLEDVNFGSGYYEVSYMTADGAMSFGMKNLTSLKYIFPVIGKENVRFELLVVPLDDALLVYGACSVEAAGFVKSLIHLPSAFYTRIRALKDWFSKQAY